MRRSHTEWTDFARVLPFERGARGGPARSDGHVVGAAGLSAGNDPPTPTNLTQSQSHALGLQGHGAKHNIQCIPNQLTGKFPL